MRVSRNGDCDVDTGTYSSPDEPRHTLRPLSAQDLDCQTDGVDVGAVVGDNTQSQNDEAEFAKATKRSKKYSAEETSRSGSLVAICVLVVAVVQRSSGHDRYAQHLSEEKRNDETDPDGKEDLRPRLVTGLVDCVVCCVAGPSCCETVDDTSKAEHTSQFAGAYTHWDVDEGSGVGEDAKDDDEDDGSRNPGPEFIDVDDLVTKERHAQCAKSDDEDTSVAWNIVVDGIDQLSANDRVHRRPAKAGKDVKHSNCDLLARDPQCKNDRRTDLDSIPAEPVTRQNHLSQAKTRSESGEVADRDDTDEIEEQADQASIRETEKEE